jgi:hypothetical protein
LINAWNLRHGIAFDAPSSALARGSRGSRTIENRYQNDEAGPRRRGSLAVWIEDTALECWQTCGPGVQPCYSDAAVQASLMLRTAFKLPLRQTEGLLASVLTLMKLTISAPDHTAVSRRAVKLPVIQPA